MEEVNVEVEAKKMGWVPKESFRGDTEKWVDANTFVERGKNMIPLLKENIERMSNKYGVIENELKETRKTVGEFVEYAKKGEERAFERAKKQYEKEIADLKSHMKAAAKAGDGEAYEQLEQRMERLEPPEKPEVKVETKTEPVAPEETPAMKAWKGENTWFLKDNRMTKYAISIEGDVAAEHPGASQSEILKAIADEVKQRFPDKFTNPNRERGGSVDTGDSDSRRKSSGGKGFEDLPADAKKAFKKFHETFKAAGKEYTKEDYLKDYEWEE